MGIRGIRVGGSSAEGKMTILLAKGEILLEDAEEASEHSSRKKLGLGLSIS